MKRNKMAAKAERVSGKVAEIIANNGAWVEMDDRQAFVNACNEISIHVNGGAFFTDLQGGAGRCVKMQYFYI